MEVQKLASLRDTLTEVNDKYWADQVEIQRESAEAWIRLDEGKSEEVLRQMRSAAEHEDASDTLSPPESSCPLANCLGRCYWN